MTIEATTTHPLLAKPEPATALGAALGAALSAAAALNVLGDGAQGPGTGRGWQ